MSAAFHELIVFGIFGTVNFISFILMWVNAPLMVAQTVYFRGLVSKNTHNILFWFFYLMLAQPFGALFCYYQVGDSLSNTGFDFMPDAKTGLPPVMLASLSEQIKDHLNEQIRNGQLPV